MLRKIIILLVLLKTTGAFAQNPDPNAGIIPAPLSVKKLPGEFVFSDRTMMQADTLGNKAVLFLADYLLTERKFKNPVSTHNRTSNTGIVLTAKGTEGLPADGYRLTISPNQVIIAGKGVGLFYGIQTFIQLLPNERTSVIKLPCVTIEDYPRFGYRGMMLDVSRHFFTVASVKKYLDMMAAYKLNNFHWHLTDDQGWRIEIKKYPKLTQIGSQRAQTVIGNYHDRMPQWFDQTPYGGYYTQDQIREVVKYATDRFINVVPEIEMPGHALGALAAYPELGCEPDKDYQVAQTWGVFSDVYCPSETTFNFLQDVLTEVMTLFPGKYIHIGGDECPKDAWKKSAFCQQLIKKLKLKDEHGLQSYFIQRMEKFVNSKGRKIIGWDEILEGGLAPNATVMSWRGEAGGIAAAQQKHDVIMTPASGGLYLDHAQGKSDQEPVNIGGYAPLEKIYAYNPIPKELNANEQSYIKGVQANNWTEYIATPAKLEYMMLPRMLALAEVSWSALGKKDFKNFSEQRLPKQLGRLESENYNFRVPAAIGVSDTLMFGSQFRIELKPPVEGARIYYTIDGYTPRETDLEYSLPLNFNIPAGEQRELKTITITASNKQSVVTTTVMSNRAPLKPVSYNSNQQGLKYSLRRGAFKSARQLDLAEIIDTGISKNFVVSGFKKDNNSFGLVYDGFIRIDADGKYTFSLASDDGSQLFIDDEKIVDNDGTHTMFEKGAEVPLLKGFHKIKIKYFDTGSSGSLKVYLSQAGKPKTDLPPDILFH